MGHPSSWRLHRAHPALGLEEMEDDLLPPPGPRELGAAWLALPADEQRRREADFMAAVERAGADPASDWKLELELGTLGGRGIRMDRWKAPALERELLDHVWQEARRRDEAASREVLTQRRQGEAGRVLRAHVRIRASRLRERPVSTAVAVLAVAGMLGWHPLGWL